MAGNELQPEATAPTGTGPRGDAPIQPGIDYRRIQQPTELRQPWHIPSSGAASEAEELAHSLKTFGKEAGGLSNMLNSQAGKAAGAQAGLDTKTFQPKTGLAAVTAFGASYNAAAHVSYVANTQTSIEEAINAAEQAHPHDPIAYADQVQKVRNATLAETPSLYQPEVQTMFDRRIEAGHNRIAEATIKQSQADGVASYTGTLESRIKTAVRTAADLPEDKATATLQQAQHDNATMVDGLVASGAISKERGETAKTEFQDKIVEEAHTHHAESVAGNWISTARTTQDITSGDRALASYVNNPANSNEDKARVGAEWARQREQFEHQQGALHAPEVQALADHLEQIPGEKEGRGASGPEVQASIENMRKQGWISTEVARSMSERSVHNGAKGQVDDADTYNFNEVMQGRQPKWDPKDTRAAKAADTGFKTLVAANGLVRGSSLYNNAAVSVMSGTSIIPPTIRKEIMGDEASGDPDRAAAAVRLREQLHAANPQADVYQDDTKAAAFGDILRRNLEAKMSNAQAYQMAREQTDPPRDVQEQRTLQYSNAVRTATDKNPRLANNEMLDAKLKDSGISGKHWYGNEAAPATTPAMRAEYEGLTKEFFTRTGKIDQAQDLAYTQLMKTWSMSDINGKPELMKWGPTQEEVPMMKIVMAQALKEHGLAEDSSVHLTESPRTSLSQGDRWNMTDAKGDLILGKNNQPIEINKAYGRPAYEATLAKQKAADDAREAANLQARRTADENRAALGMGTR